ncbi:MAG: MerC domain-containing protein [Balneolaceae bacterium]|nr:MerC domain-containing protein [Balneolaceae bacterium]
MKNNRKEGKGFWDRLGIGLSGLCAIHCLLVPVFVSLIPLWPTFEEFHEYTHLVFFIAIVPAVVISLRKRHASRKISFYLFGGLLIIFVAWFFNQQFGEYGEAGVTLAGSVLLIRGHWLNYKCKRF